jgi:hypothetical protein
LSDNVTSAGTALDPFSLGQSKTGTCCTGLIIVGTRVPCVICRSAVASGPPSATLVRRKVISRGFINAATVRTANAVIATGLISRTRDALAIVADQITAIGRTVATVTTGHSTLPVHTTFGRGAIILIDAHRR